MSMQCSEATEAYPLGLELKVTVSYVLWVLGTESRPSARAVGTLNHRVASLTPLTLRDAMDEDSILKSLNDVLKAPSSTLSHGGGMNLMSSGRHMKAPRRINSWCSGRSPLW